MSTSELDQKIAQGLGIRTFPNHEQMVAHIMSLKSLVKTVRILYVINLKKSFIFLKFRSN